MCAGFCSFSFSFHFLSFFLSFFHSFFLSVKKTINFVGRGLAGAAPFFGHCRRSLHTYTLTHTHTHTWLAFAINLYKKHSFLKAGMTDCLLGHIQYWEQLCEECAFVASFFLLLPFSPIFLFCIKPFVVCCTLEKGRCLTEKVGRFCKIMCVCELVGRVCSHSIWTGYEGKSWN